MALRYRKKRAAGPLCAGATTAAQMVAVGGVRPRPFYRTARALSQIFLGGVAEPEFSPREEDWATVRTGPRTATRLWGLAEHHWPAARSQCTRHRCSALS